MTRRSENERLARRLKAITNWLCPVCQSPLKEIRFGHSHHKVWVECTAKHVELFTYNNTTKEYGL